MAETDGDANPAASSGAVAEDDRDAAFLEAARSAAAASLEKRRAHQRAREARARSATVAARAPNLGSIDESRVVNGDGRTDTIAGASNGGVARKVVARASDGVDRLAGTPASHRHGDENGNAKDDENANKTALGDDVSPALVRGREGARAVVDGSDPIGVTAVFIETDRVAAGAFETIFCGYADGSIRRFHRPAPAPENVGNARGKTTRAGWTELDAVHAPEPWNDAAGSVRIIKRVGSGRAGKADDEGGGGRLFAAFDNGSWVRFEMTRGQWRLVETPVLGPRYGTWRFKPWSAADGSDTTWSDPSFDDSGWQAVKGGQDWRNASNFTDENATGWYRQAVTVPDHLLTASNLVLSLGVIAGADQAWVNGISVGQVRAATLALSRDSRL